MTTILLHKHSPHCIFIKAFKRKKRDALLVFVQKLLKIFWFLILTKKHSHACDEALSFESKCSRLAAKNLFSNCKDRYVADVAKDPGCRSRIRLRFCVFFGPGVKNV